jgi:hypothetical protein
VIFDWDTIREDHRDLPPAASAATHEADTLPIMLQVNGNPDADDLD